MRYPSSVVDRQGVYASTFMERQREYIKTLISDDLIEEHRRDPIAQHSDDLERVLHFFRSGRCASGKHALLQEDPKVARYRIIRETGQPGKRIEIEDGLYNSYAEAAHAVFLARVADLMDN